MADYIEGREFTLRIDARCAFPDDYDGEADGYAWWAELEPAAAEIVRAAVDILSRHPGWSVRPGNRGRASAEEVTLLIEKTAR